MHTAKLIALPRKLADTLDTYYQTSAFAQKNFTKFNKDMLIGMIRSSAAKLGYDTVVGEGKSGGQFVFTRKTQVLRVTRANFPNAEVRIP